jgi:hypothetical protein
LSGLLASGWVSFWCSQMYYTLFFLPSSKVSSFSFDERDVYPSKVFPLRTGFGFGTSWKRRGNIFAPWMGRIFTPSSCKRTIKRSSSPRAKHATIFSIRNV